MSLFETVPAEPLEARAEFTARGRLPASGPAGAEDERERGGAMDGTRARRTRDRARQTWYAGHRQRRFARWLGFGAAPAPEAGSRSTRMTGGSGSNGEKISNLV